MSVRASQRVRSVLACVALALVVSACGKKPKPSAPPPELTGLAAVPANAEVVIGADVDRLAGSPLIARAAQQLLLRDAPLATSWQHVRDACKLDLSKLRRVMVALGPAAADARPGTGPVLMVATGALAEAELATCVRSLVGKGGGTLTARPLDGRTLYQVKDGNRTMFFAFGRPDTVVLGSNEAYVTEALGTGKKALDNAELAGWIQLADQNAPLWAAGRVSERVRQGLVRVTEGKLSAGPAAFVGSIDPTSGAKLSLGAVMTTADDAKQLESQVKAQLAALVMVAQLKSLGPVVQKITTSVDGKVVRFDANLSMDDVNHVLSVLDGTPSPKQDSPPPSGSASGSGSAAGSNL